MEISSLSFSRSGQIHRRPPHAVSRQHCHTRGSGRAAQVSHQRAMSSCNVPAVTAQTHGHKHAVPRAAPAARISPLELRSQCRKARGGVGGDVDERGHGAGAHERGRPVQRPRRCRRRHGMYLRIPRRPSPPDAPGVAAAAELHSSPMAFAAEHQRFHGQKRGVSAKFDLGPPLEPRAIEQDRRLAAARRGRLLAPRPVSLR